MPIEFKVINDKGRQILMDTWPTKKQAQLALINLIYGTCLSDHREEAIKYLSCRVVRIWPKYELTRDNSGYLAAKKIKK